MILSPSVTPLSKQNIRENQNEGRKIGCSGFEPEPSFLSSVLALPSGGRGFPYLTLRLGQILALKLRYHPTFKEGWTLPFKVSYHITF